MTDLPDLIDDDGDENATPLPDGPGAGLPGDDVTDTDIPSPTTATDSDAPAEQDQQRPDPCETDPSTVVPGSDS